MGYGIMAALIPKHGSSGDPIYDFRDNQRFCDDEEGRHPSEGDRCPTDTGRDQCSNNQSVGEAPISLGAWPPAKFSANPDREWKRSLSPGFRAIVDVSIVDKRRNSGGRGADSSGMVPRGELSLNLDGP